MTEHSEFVWEVLKQGDNPTEIDVQTQAKTRSTGSNTRDLLARSIRVQELYYIESQNKTTLLKLKSLQKAFLQKLWIVWLDTKSSIVPPFNSWTFHCWPIFKQFVKKGQLDRKDLFNLLPYQDGSHRFIAN